MDHNATTPLDPAVLDAMLPYWRGSYANPSSRHALGLQQRHHVEAARERIAAVIGVDPVQVIFTSGGTEANNLFVQGAAHERIAHTIWVSPYEHPCIAEPAKALTRRGWKHAFLPVCANGELDVEAWKPEDNVSKGDLVSVMLANNESGAILPVKTVAERAKAKGAWVHTDAVQAVGKWPVRFEDLGVDAMTLSPHKFYGPKGIGALVISKRLDLQPMLRGGGQEKGRRSGTEAVPLMMGFAAALERADQQRQTWMAHVQPLRDQFEQGVKSLGAYIFAEDTPRLPNTSYFCFEGINGDSWVMALDRAGFAVSSGSACSSQNPGPSRVVLAMGHTPQVAESAVRISLGWENTSDSIHALLLIIKQALSDFRSMPAFQAS